MSHIVAVYTLATIFGLSCILSLVTLRLYVRNNSRALLKIAMLGWYSWLCFMSMFNVAIAHSFESTQTTWTTVYNTTGQIMALTGILDVAQFAYCRIRLLRLHEANTLFFKAYAIGVAILTIALVIQATLEELDVVDLLAYRTFSLVFISAEFVAYCWAIVRVMNNKRAVVYYALTLCSRFGIVFTVACRVSGWMSNEVFRGVHAGVVLFAVAAIGAFNLPYIMQATASISGFRSQRYSSRRKVHLADTSKQTLEQGVAVMPMQMPTPNCPTPGDVTPQPYRNSARTESGPRYPSVNEDPSERDGCSQSNLSRELRAAVHFVHPRHAVAPEAAPVRPSPGPPSAESSPTHSPLCS